jgi:hypothetical protein
MDMASLDELMAQLHQVSQKTSENITLTGQAAQTAEQVLGQFQALGAEAQVQAAAQIREGIHQLIARQRANIELGNQLINRTKAAKG